MAAESAERVRGHQPVASYVDPTPIRRLDDLAYGWGVWQGALRRGTTEPLRPRLALRLVSLWTAGGRP